MGRGLIKILPLFLAVLSSTRCNVRGQGDTGKTNPSEKPFIGCDVIPANEKIASYFQRDSAVMTIYELEMANYTIDPLRSDVTEYYTPWKWYRTRSEHGKTLMTLSFNYDVLSMTILTIGVLRIPVVLRDEPYGCFGNLTSAERINLIRENIFDNLQPQQAVKDKSSEDSANWDPREVFVCSEVIRNHNGYADFANACCSRGNDGKVTCSEEEQNLWITVLYVCITLVKITMFIFGPLVLPAHMYTAAYVAAEYAVRLQQDIKMRVFISDSPQASVRYKHRLTLDDFAVWRRFQESLEDLPKEEVVPVKVPELRIKVKGKRVIPENDPPTGLLRTLYDNLVRCQVKSLDPFKDCCDKSVYSSLQPHIGHKCTWIMFSKALIKILLLLLIPFPFYARVFIYYHFEEAELYRRKETVEALGLQQTFNVYRTNIIQYLTPTHSLFIATYIFYFLSGIMIGFSNPCVRETLKSIARSALQDMQYVSRTAVLQLILRISLWPFRKCGLCALILAPLFSIVAIPLCTLIILLYCIPTFYLTFRLLHHCWKKLEFGGGGFLGSANPSKRRVQKVRRFHKKLATVDQSVHRRGDTFSSLTDDRTSPCMFGYGKCFALRRLFIQLAAAVFCLTVLYATLLLFVEAVGLCVEVMAFTMMGIIVNAGSTLRYVTMALLVIVYMHNCYNNVYENYLTFDQTVIAEIMDRVSDLKKVASLPSSIQENFGFQVKPVEAVDEIQTTLNLEKSEPKWRIGHLILFLDSNDTPRIPLKLFKQLCEVRIHGAPGPVYVNLLRATAKFSIIVVFLFFVMIVVMAFGSVHQMSSTNQTLATMAGGFVPMLLKNVLSSKSVKLNLKTLSFKGQIDEIIAEFKQNWPIYDFVMEKYDPDEEKDKEEEEARDEGGGKDENKEKDKEGEKDKDDKSKDKPKDDNPEKEKDKSKLDDLNKRTQEMRRLSILPPDYSDDESGTSEKSAFRRSSLDENYADLFIDLSSNEEHPWQWMSGSSQSLESITMLNTVTVTNDENQSSDRLHMPYTPDLNPTNNGLAVPVIRVDPN